ncbi:hypothetical protein D9757_011133 [Collybiopsis confluens]|uniref:Uncharacterized protein n=1 Tax=Collybiopsis confluens TaxID=2823264 RepID=A0A8H5H817_9AGAR|nr:hypothetical protein D9757_011133 [Collybiopsis confluens]
MSPSTEGLSSGLAPTPGFVIPAMYPIFIYGIRPDLYFANNPERLLCRAPFHRDGSTSPNPSFPLTLLLNPASISPLYASSHLLFPSSFSQTWVIFSSAATPLSSQTVHPYPPSAQSCDTSTFSSSLSPHTVPSNSSTSSPASYSHLFTSTLPKISLPT